MSHDIYIFGSLVRGEVSHTSDVDVLVIPQDGGNVAIYPEGWSVYSRETMQKYFDEGRLFAWHLHREAKCIHAAAHSPWLTTLGAPARYAMAVADIEALELLMHNSLQELRMATASVVYELGIVYTAVRDIAMAASWRLLGNPCFSRRAPFLLPMLCPLDEAVYEIAMAARHCSTRGSNVPSNLNQAVRIVLNAPLAAWVANIKRQF
jgi:hypothetical protein